MNIPRIWLPTLGKAHCIAYNKKIVTFRAKLHMAVDSLRAWNPKRMGLLIHRCMQMIIDTLSNYLLELMICQCIDKLLHLYN